MTIISSMDISGKRKSVDTKYLHPYSPPHGPQNGHRHDLIEGKKEKSDEGLSTNDVTLFWIICHLFPPWSYFLAVSIYQVVINGPEKSI